VKEDEYEDKRR